MNTMQFVRVVVLTGLMVNLIGASAAHARERLTGTWLTEDKSTQVLFQPCGQDDCARIVWLRDPIDTETGKPLLDKFNPDAASKNRPLIGLTVAAGLNLSRENTSEAQFYNPLDGNTYLGRLKRLTTDRLQIEVCALGGLFCSTEMWTLAAP